MMRFNPCIIIPIYNHKDTIAAVVDRLSVYGYPVLIVDDGSDQATRHTLVQLAEQQPTVTLFHLPQNAGKGAAVLHGMRQAHRLGFSHALQVDADGQHDLDDVPAFMSVGESNPWAVISGKPIYDASAPAGRRYGRLVTHFWVWVETLSFSIGDSMCGFRLYPVAPTVQLIDRVRIPSRMAFDIEIIVRLFWAGLPVINQPTRVIYPEGGLSHFDMLRDNVRISAMHTRLFFGMLWRSPLLLWRKCFPRRFEEQHWSRQDERGTSLGLRLVMLTYRLLGDAGARALLRLIVLWFALTSGRARRASYEYLSRLHQVSGGVTPAPGWRNAYRHILSFAESGLDKLAAWTGRVAHRAIRFPQQPAFETLLASGKGAVLLGAHLGNLEMLRALANLNGIARVNAVVYTEHAQRFNGALSSVNPQFQVNLLQISDMGPDTAIRLRDKVDQGELLVIVGDRTPPADNGRVVPAQFLGHEALFPQGPFILGALLECPVYLFFCLKTDTGYQVEFEAFAEQLVLPRGERQQAISRYVQQYADRLAWYCQQAPLQWFNFFDFWARNRKQ
ncbi:glycosyltransferase family 2 protein [Leeia aquatica]|nr:glycosyltransferase family 2 protein [Leeia aquatica]